MITTLPEGLLGGARTRLRGGRRPAPGLVPGVGRGPIINIIVTIIIIIISIIVIIIIIIIISSSSSRSSSCSISIVFFKLCLFAFPLSVFNCLFA